MTTQIKIIPKFLILFFLTRFAYAQNANNISTTSNTTDLKSDSTALRSLLVKLLKWHQTDKKSDFETITNNPTDSIYTGINWPLHKKRLAELEATNLFTTAFLDNYQNIARHLDKELKQNKTKYFVGDLAPYGNEANEWCNCQDYPADIWKRLKIVNLAINGHSASFKWSWGNNFFYAVNATKENNEWRIAALEKFTIKNFSW